LFAAWAFIVLSVGVPALRPFPWACSRRWLKFHAGEHPVEGGVVQGGEPAERIGPFQHPLLDPLGYPVGQYQERTGLIIVN